MIKALSHLVITSEDVKAITHYFSLLFNTKPHFANDDFSDFVLSDNSRIAFFRPTGKAKKFFNNVDTPSNVSYGVTVDNVDMFYQHALKLCDNFDHEFSGEPKDHPWGEKSFLIIDIQGNRWEITQSPSASGKLINKEME